MANGNDAPLRYADWTPVLDPADHEMLLLQDVVGRRWDAWPTFPGRYEERTVMPSTITRSSAVPDFSPFSDSALAAWISGMREAMFLPLSAPFHDGLVALLRDGEGEAKRRLRTPRRRLDTSYTEFDLLGAVEGFVGAQGRIAGRDVWFSCPWHSDSTPSLHVEAAKRIWHCFACNKGGGVREWQVAIKQG